MQNKINKYRIKEKQISRSMSEQEKRRESVSFCVFYSFFRNGIGFLWYTLYREFFVDFLLLILDKEKTTNKYRTIRKGCMR